MNDKEFFDLFGIKAGQCKPAWVFRNGLVVVEEKVVSTKLTDFDGSDLNKIAKTKKTQAKRVFVLSSRELIYLDREFPLLDPIEREQYLIDNAAIGVYLGNIFVVKDERANDVANREYLPEHAIGVSRKEFMEHFSR